VAGDDVTVEDVETGDQAPDDVIELVNEHYLEFNMVQPSEAYPDASH